MSNSRSTAKKGRYYVVPAGSGRQPGIFDNYEDAQAQTKGFPNGCAHKFASLELANEFWFYHHGGMDAPPVFSAEKVAKAGTLFYVDREGHEISRYVEGAVAERIARFMRSGTPLS